MSKHPSQQRGYFPCGHTRREFVWEMGAGFAGLALTSLLEGDGFFARHARAASPSPSANPLSPRPPHFPSKVRSVIFLMMNCGPSQVDTFDEKPELARYAGQTLPGGKKFINSGGRKIGYLTPAFRKFRPGGRSGLRISDYFPRVQIGRSSCRERVSCDV
jgi:hypothetical protein